MIISASRRTDIPAFYGNWFMNRLRDGMVLVPNPWNPHQLSRVRLTPDTVACIVFWTKNPAPMLPLLPRLDAMGYCSYFTFTLTGYGRDLERGLPPKEQAVETFLRLADAIGPDRVDWRFDPIMLTERYTEAWHADIFGALCQKLRGATRRCIINFVRPYRHLGKRVREPEREAVVRVASSLASIASECGMPAFSCTARQDVVDAGLALTACIDKGKIETLIGKTLSVKKDPGQPKICRCVESVDIGVYSTCGHGCAYCYGIRSETILRRNLAAHDPESPMLVGRPDGTETVVERSRASLACEQYSLFGNGTQLP